MDAKWMDFCPSCHGREDDHFYLCWRDGSFFFFKQGQSTYGLVELCKGPNSLLTWLLISISVLINP